MVCAPAALPMRDLIACFLDEFSKANIPEPLQRELYENYGREQLATVVRTQLGTS